MVRFSRLLSVLGICVLLMACSITFPTSQSTQSTAVAASIEAELTARALSATPTSTATTVPTATTEPTSTPSPTALPSNTPVPPVVVTTPAPQVSCYAATFVTDVTIQDGTVMKQAESFTKTWRVTNSGTCAWSGYQLVFVGGERLGAPDAIPQPGIINPGGTVDVSVQLSSPSSTGDFTGYFKLKASDGTVFGMSPYNASLSVVISTQGVALKPLPQLTFVAPGGLLLLRPDMYVSEFSINNGAPIPGGVDVPVRIGVYNKGTVKAENFDVEFWGLETFASRSCAWDIDAMNAKGGQILTCTVKFTPGYADGLKAKVWIDRLDMVAESDENNNVYLAPLDFQ